MDRKDDFWNNSEENNTPFEAASSSENTDLENKALATPETYYHNINTPEGEKEDRYYEIFDKSKKTMGWSVASLVLGIVSVLCCCLGWVGLLMGALAIVFAVVSRVSLGYFDGMSIAGLILGIFGVVFGGVMLGITLLAATDEFKSYTEQFPIEEYYNNFDF
ncbi:MAG: DUF4190 domain-containing protein [Clostridia bacterium]|nr:DUF4190 domain-containing protein [Clostridia bacterium]